MEFRGTLAGTGCRVSLTAEFELRSLHSYDEFLDRVLPTATADIIAAFETRAHSLYDAQDHLQKRLAIKVAAYQRS